MAAEPLEPPAFVPGKHFGRYEVLCELARGGMGAVAVGRLQGVHGVRRLVALKIIHAHLTRDEQYTRMFLREAEIASLLHHGNVVPVLELGQEGAQYYLVMEYFPSLSLLQLLREAARRDVPVPYAFSAAVIADACAGLHSAHELRDARGELLGVVHRDATPSNLLLGEDGAVKVTDFGVARAASAMVDQLTGESGVAKGKLSYLSPEQVRGEATDRRSDVFTLGVVLYEMLGRTRLFRAANELALVRAIIEDPIPDVRAANGEVPDALAAIVSRALQRDRTKRFQSAAEMQDALLDAHHALPVVSRGALVRELLGEEFAARREEIATAEAVLGMARSATASSEPSGRSAAQREASLGASVQENAARAVSPVPAAGDEAPTLAAIPSSANAARAATRAGAPSPEASGAGLDARGIPPAREEAATPVATTSAASEAASARSAASASTTAPAVVAPVARATSSSARSRWTAPLIVTALIGAGAAALLWPRAATHPAGSSASPRGEQAPTRTSGAASEPAPTLEARTAPVVGTGDTSARAVSVSAQPSADAGAATLSAARPGAGTAAEPADNRALHHSAARASEQTPSSAHGAHQASETATRAARTERPEPASSEHHGASAHPTAPAAARPASTNTAHPAASPPVGPTPPSAPAGRPRLEM